MTNENGLKLKQCREQWGLTQDDIADAIGGVRHTISDWERGHTKLSDKKFVWACSCIRRFLDRKKRRWR